MSESIAVANLPVTLVYGATLLPSQDDIFPLLPKNIILAEVGAVLGAFSEAILQRCETDHSYNHVKVKLDVSRLKLRKDGWLILNGYILLNHFSSMHYGVIPAVHEFTLKYN